MVQFKKAKFMYVFPGCEVSKVLFIYSMYVIALPVMPLRVNDWHNGPLFTPLVWAWPSSPVSPSTSTLLHAPRRRWKQLETDWRIERGGTDWYKRPFLSTKTMGSLPQLFSMFSTSPVYLPCARPGHSPWERPLFWHLKWQVCSMCVMMPQKIPNVTNKMQKIIK